MKRTGLRIAFNSLIAVLLLTSGLFTSELSAGAQGTFRGEVMRAPQGERSAGLLYLMGRDGNVRRVVVARAVVVYDSSVPSRERSQSARKALVPGAEVRVTALVDAKSGEWTASRVEVISQHASASDDENGEDDNTPDDVTSPKETTILSRTI
jgi:hypothetical protein